ncbi:acyl-CoA dehydrogenase family protein [Pseudoduganella sp. UC29_106]|uniref:acyl-CoA dehydrogenase family protein n=1 Tax=Pseudoduganella sp. UC29_106 TaxID=3374553 RepID=UPI003757E45D
MELKVKVNRFGQIYRPSSRLTIAKPLCYRQSTHNYRDRTMSIDFAFSADDLLFREQVRAFLAAKLPPDVRQATRRNGATFVSRDVALKWQGILNDQGWLAYNWPAAFGGTGWSPIQRFIFERECALADAPRLIPMGLRYVGAGDFHLWQRVAAADFPAAYPQR